MTLDKSKPVLVTGGNGYVASWLVKYLLEDGVDVHATVRDPANKKKVGHLEAIAADAPGTLTLHAADLFDENAFDAPMQGCEVVFHTASPFVISGIDDPQAELVDPALKGTENVLNAVNRVESVKRVVLTSSVVAIYGDAADMADEGVDAFTEAHWNTTSSVDHQPYNYSKVCAERRAWEINEQQARWQLVTINPGFVLGPSLTQASASTSLATMKQFADGTLKMGAPELYFGIVDVRDVALAHIKAASEPEASGRHITCSETLSMLDMGAALRRAFGDRYPFPRRELPKTLLWLVGPFQGLARKFVARNVGYPLAFDNSYTRRDLAMDFRPARETVVEHFQQMLDDGVVRRRD
ncbi:NAD-dependent epimerase/dehydratase family protein [Endozoicomonas sp. G2_2]|uniref:NAD-dependent epimerase/dehydratase family protein n=1 Tax=Endozoicomonas sp. G2_2 TaxID=2821092 RepID=UPI001ADAF94A|nr:NAD-dependent epimerase/dehydratase family protein [Endozoicomonas sp. G2_2]MBO9469067.1 NAD-dependent epimerase/dehydratase family protein [Endozoicomonas sp. G2_2]